MAIKGRFPAIRPSLDLNFAKTKRLDPRITFTRASIGTYVGRDGLIKTAGVNEARFDHNPTTGESLGLLVEEARTNLVRNNTMVGAVAGSPGTPPTNGWVIVNNATYTSSILGTGTENGINYIDIQYVVAAGAAATGGLIFGDLPAGSSLTTYTGSYYLKLVSGSSPQIRFIWQDGINTTGTSFFNLTSSLTRYTNTLTTAVGATLVRFGISIDAAPSGATFVIRVGLPQVEQGAFATSVIPTTSATVTRAADVASITGANFSSWYNQAEGSFFCSTFAPKGNVVYGTGDTFDNTQYVTVASSNNVSIRSGGANSSILTAPVSTTALTNIAHGYAADNFAAVSNGGTIATDTSGAVPLAQVRLKLGSSAWDAGGTNILNGTIKRLTYWPQRLSNATLQALTS